MLCMLHALRAASSSRGILILPGLGNNAGDYEELRLKLQQLPGLEAETCATQINEMHTLKTTQQLEDATKRSSD